MNARELVGCKCGMEVPEISCQQYTLVYSVKMTCWADSGRLCVYLFMIFFLPLFFFKSVRTMLDGIGLYTVMYYVDETDCSPPVFVF